MLSQKTKILLAGLGFILCYALSFPFVIPGQDAPAWPHLLFGNWLVFLTLPLFCFVVDQFSSTFAKWAAGSLLASLGSIPVFYWVYYAIHVFGNVSISLTVFIMFLMMAALGTIFWGTFALIYTFLARRNFALPSLLAAVWTLIEAVRTFFPVDFYWSALGHSQYNNLFFIQFAALGSTYIISFFIAWSSLTVYSWIRKHPFRFDTIGFLVFFILLTLFTISHRKTIRDAVPVSTPRISVLQPNLTQDQINNKLTYRSEIIDVYTPLLSEIPDSTNLLIWHEAALPLLLPRSFTDFRRIWADFFPGQYLFENQIIGFDLFSQSPEGYYNSAGFVIKGKIERFYDKIKLAPFGEYLPYSSFFNSIGLSELVPYAAGSGFTRGTDYTVYDFGFAKASALICFDGTFSEHVRNFVLNGANLLVNITNDAWFGHSSAAFQHDSFYPFRAVETGRTIVRAANIGISGIILPDGSKMLETKLFEKTTFTRQVPIYTIETPYLKYGNFFLVILGFYVAGWWFISIFSRRKSRN